MEQLHQCLVIMDGTVNSMKNHSDLLESIVQKAINVLAVPKLLAHQVSTKIKLDKLNVQSVLLVISVSRHS